MKITITITKVLEDWWIGDDCDATDAELIDLVQEDVFAFLDGATWSVTRETTS